MKGSICVLALLLSAGLCMGCGSERVESSGSGVGSSAAQVEEPVSSADSSVPQAVEELDGIRDYSEELQADVDNVVSNSASLREELEGVETLSQKYTELAKTAQTQGEMNVASGWFFTLWDTELNRLWDRFGDSADQQTKEQVLAEQRNWIAMKEEAALLSVGTSEENGSMYPLLRNAFLEEITRNRAYLLADELAKVKGEDFAVPEAPVEHSLFVDNQGTGRIYSFLLVQQDGEGRYQAKVSVYRQGEIEGSYTGNGSATLDFTSDDGAVKGTIQLNGWDGAVFRVTEVSGESPFSVGEETEFPFAF